MFLGAWLHKSSIVCCVSLCHINVYCLTCLNTFIFKKIISQKVVILKHLLKTDDIHPPKTGISVHFSILFMYIVCRNESNIQYTTDVTMGNALLYSKREHLLLYTDIWKVSQAEDKSGSSDIGVTLLPLRGALITATYPGRCPGLCTAAPSGRMFKTDVKNLRIFCL